MDPIEAFVDPELHEHGQRKMAEILDGREWTGVVPFKVPEGAEGEPGKEGLAEVYVMPTRTEEGERAAVCIVVDVRILRRIETDLAASQSIFGQSPFGFLLIDPDLRVRRANQQIANTFGGTPTTTAAGASTTICRAPRPSGSPRPCAASWRPATPSRTCRSPVWCRAPTSAATGPSTSTACTAEAAGPSVSPGSAPTSPSAAPPPARPPPRGAISPF